MVKKVTLSLLALLFLLYIVWYVVPVICHSPRFGSEAGNEFQASSNATVPLGAGPLQGTEPHREAMVLMSPCCGVAATFCRTWLASSWRPTVSAIMHYVAPQIQSRLASSEVLERRAGAVELGKLPAFLLPHGQGDAIFNNKIHTRFFMKYNYSLNFSADGDRARAEDHPAGLHPLAIVGNGIAINHSGNFNSTNHSGNHDPTNHSGNLNITNHSDTNLYHVSKR